MNVLNVLLSYKLLITILDKAWNEFSDSCEFLNFKWKFSLEFTNDKTSDQFNIFKEIVLQCIPPSAIYLHLSPTIQLKLTDDYLSF